MSDLPTHYRFKNGRVVKANDQMHKRAAGRGYQPATDPAITDEVAEVAEAKPVAKKKAAKKPAKKERTVHAEVEDTPAAEVKVSSKPSD
jgi:hypothetical protein